MHVSIRNSIILTLCLILLTQATFLPVLLSILFAVVIALFYIYTKRQKRTSKVITFLFVVIALSIIFFSFRTFLGVDAGLAVLSTFLFAKSLETKDKRDIIILFNFALFVSASCFLQSQAIWMAGLVLLCFVSCLIGLYRLQSIEFYTSEKQQSLFIKDAKDVSKLIVLAVPFFVLLFLFFPRLPPLWHIPIPDDTGVTGISDTMSPGDIAKLSQSSELAFRIIGNIQQLPERSELYWRAMVLDQYDGQTWTRNYSNQQPIQRERLQQVKSQFEYEYLAADSRTQWVMALENSIPQERGYGIRADWSIVPMRPSNRVTPISLQWLGQSQIEGLDRNIPDWIQSINVKYPATDQQTRQLAQRLFQDSRNNPKRYIENVLNWYRTNGFVYTLEPGKLGQNRIDEFLFQTRQGFCEHYASSFVMFMRYVGIPARVVVGYQGGQLSPDGETWEVRQLDAHAWSEVYIDGRWQRYDPTAIIAPERIDTGMQNLISNQQSILGDQQNQWKYRQFNALNKVRIWSDYLGYQWQSKVVGYDVERQKNWFSKLGFNSAYTAVGVLVSGILLFVFVYYLWTRLVKIYRQDPIESAFGKLSKQLPKELHKSPSEPTTTWLKRVSSHVDGKDANVFMECSLMYEKFKYSDQYDQQALLEMINTCTSVAKRM